MVELLKYLMPMLPKERPNHLLGVGDLPSIEQSIPLGVDTFDSSHPTKCARHGLLFTRHGFKRIAQKKYSEDFGPLEDGCTCPACAHYSMAYLHHLFKAHEITGMTLASIHNVHFMIQLMKRYREQILRDEV